MVKVFFNLKTTGVRRKTRSIVQIGAVVDHEGSTMKFEKFLLPLRNSVFEDNEAVVNHGITFEGTQANRIFILYIYLGRPGPEIKFLGFPRQFE